MLNIKINNTANVIIIKQPNISTDNTVNFSFPFKMEKTRVRKIITPTIKVIMLKRVACLLNFM